MKTDIPPVPADKIGRLALDSQMSAILAASGGQTTRDTEAGTLVCQTPKGTELLRAIQKGGPAEPWIVIYSRAFYCADNAGHVHRISIRRHVNGSPYERSALIDPHSRRPRAVPVDLLPLAAGPDAWLRDVMVPCVDCRKLTRAGDMTCQLCPTCNDKAEQENADANA